MYSNFEKRLQWAGGKSQFLNLKAKQNDAKQIFMHDFAPTNLEYGSRGLKKKIKCFYKIVRKNKNNTYAVFTLLNLNCMLLSCIVWVSEWIYTL